MMLFHYIGKLLGSNRVGVGIELGVYVFREAKLLPRQCLYESGFFLLIDFDVKMFKKSEHHQVQPDQLFWATGSQRN